MQIPTMLQGVELTRLLQGAAVGAVATLFVGFGWGGWQLQSKAEKAADARVNQALVAALAPVCADKFQHASDAKTSLASLKATESWKRDTFIEKGGWATFQGSEPNRNVADACASILMDLK